MRLINILILSFFRMPLFAAADPPEADQEQDALVSASSRIDTLSQDTTLFYVVDTPASFPGGIDSMKRFIGHNIRIPDIYRDFSIQGKVVVGFTVEKDGSLTDLVIMRSVEEKLDSCALDVVRRMPLWEPAINEGDTVRMRFIMPVNIRW